MKREAFAMKLKPGCLVQYRQRHRDLWPELARALVLAGVRDYSIYHDSRTDTLFAFRRLADGDTADSLAAQEIVRKWWDYNADLMEVLPDNAPATHPLDEVFHLD